ncbi:MAG: YlxR family protein [Thermoleophilaceae bacterium]
MGCRQAALQEELLRLAVVDGAAVPDPERRHPGRGAYLHPRAECLERAVARGVFAKSFRRPVRVSGETVEWIEEWRENASRR